MRRAALILLVMLVSTHSLAQGLQPEDILQEDINKGISILKDPLYQDVTKKDLQRQELCETARQIFDFKEFSRLVLASNWRRFTPGQRIRFVDVFAEFLCTFYLTKLQERYSDERVIYLSQELTTESKALVKIKVLWKGVEVPVDIRMLRRHGQWKAYDISVLGVSAVRNYREQFQAILLKNAPDEVISMITRRVEQ